MFEDLYSLFPFPKFYRTHTNVGGSHHWEGASTSVLKFCPADSAEHVARRSSTTHSQSGIMELQWSDEDSQFFFSVFSLSVSVSLLYGFVSVFTYLHMYSNTTTATATNRLSCWDRLLCFQLSLLHALPVHPS